MSVEPIQAIAGVIGLFTLYLLKRYLSNGRPAHLRLPPGPKGLPIIGNLLDVPVEDEYKVFSAWQKKYGDVISLTVLGKPLIILNSPKAAQDMLNKKSSIYSSRPHYTMACDLVGWKDVLVLLPYGDRLRAYRRMIHQVIGTRASVDKFNGTIEGEAQICVRRMLKDPDNFVGPVRKGVGAIILMISHGYKVDTEKDPLVTIADEATDQLGVLLSPGNFLVDLIPALRFLPKWFPWAKFHKQADEWRHTLFEMTDKSYEVVKKQTANGTAVPNFVTNLLEGDNITEAEEFEIKWAASSLYSGGADTPVSAMSSFFLAMTMYPNVQKKAQAEIDRVVGKDRLPSFSDRDQLPYISTMIKEIIRWGPTTPLGAPHCLEEDDVYDGHFIPKGSTVLANIWHYLHDPEVYPEPNVFNPDRLIASEGKPAQRDPYEMCFGYGRRSCPGNQLADSLMFIFISTILAVYDIEKVSINGVVQEPKHDFTSGVLVRPKPFKTTLRPRSEKALALINAIEI